MKNQKIGTKLGVTVILIIAVTVGAFLWKWEKNQPDYTQPPVITRPSPEANKNESQSQSANQAVDLTDIQKQLNTLDSENGNVTYTAISKEDYSLMIGKGDKYSTGLYSDSGHFYIKYINKKLGISFVYLGNLKSYIKETIPGKLQFVEYDPTSNGSYFLNPQDNIEIYSKKALDTLEEAVKKMIIQKGANLKKCEINIFSDYMNGQALSVAYVKPFVYDTSKCLTSDKDPICGTQQASEYHQIASDSCSSFIGNKSMNYFIYQSENTTNKIVFTRHVSGLDASPWDPSTIQLFN